MDPGEVLSRGRSHADQGRYSEALADYIWFHEHALDVDRSYYGVRLSFALGYWHELAKRYRPALAALEDTAKNGAHVLLSGKGDRHLFNDVKSINRELGRGEATYRLFLDLKRLQPELAQKCARLAVEEVVLARDFELAADLLPDPETYLLQISDTLNELAQAKAPSPDAARNRLKAYVQIYCRDVRLILSVLTGQGNKNAARLAKIWAVALVDQDSVRSMVCNELTKSGSFASAIW
jgi:hypothetical protein